MITCIDPSRKDDEEEFGFFPQRQCGLLQSPFHPSLQAPQVVNQYLPEWSLHFLKLLLRKTSTLLIPAQPYYPTEVPTSNSLLSPVGTFPLTFYSSTRCHLLHEAILIYRAPLYRAPPSGLLRASRGAGGMTIALAPSYCSTCHQLPPSPHPLENLESFCVQGQRLSFLLCPAPGRIPGT